MGWFDEELNVWHAEKFMLLGISLVSLPADFGAQMIVRNNLEMRRKAASDEMNLIFNF